MRAADVDALHALWTTPEVRRFLWDDEIVPRERTATVCEESGRLFAERGYGLWLAWDATQQLVGFGGFWHFPGHEGAELLYGVAATQWGNKLGAEIARAIIDYGFTRLGMTEIIASTDAPNERSVRLLERLGRYVRGEATRYYRITA